MNSPPVDYDLCRETIADEIFKLPPKHQIDKIGIECELTPVVLQDKKIIPHQLYSRPADSKSSESSSDIILSICEKNPTWNPTLDDGGELTGVDLGESGNVSFEPGGQVEISTVPFKCLDDVLDNLDASQGILHEAFETQNVELLHLGINPWHTIDQIGLQRDKIRYRMMDQHFKSIGPFGQRMMRQTGTIQINLDFGVSEQSMAKRYIACQLLAPFSTAIFANSPIVDGSMTGYKSFRSNIWRHTDPSRTGFTDIGKIAQKLTAESCIDVYLDSLMDAVVVFKEDFSRFEQPRTFRSWLEGEAKDRPTLKDFENLMSLHFLEVRPKKFLEVRSIDGQSKALQRVPAAFFTGLIYREDVVDQVLDLLMQYAPRIETLWHQASKGLEVEEFATISKKLMDLACMSFEGLPDCYRNKETARSLFMFKAAFTDQKRCPADDILACFKRKGSIDVADFQRLEDSLQEKIHKGS